jgi:hypothetical protein
MKTLLFSAYIALVLTITGCQPLAVLNVDVGKGKTQEDLRKAEIIFEDSGLVKFPSTYSPDLYGRSQLNDQLVSSYYLEGQPGFHAEIWFSKPDGHLTYFASSKGVDQFPPAAGASVGNIIDYSKKTFGDGILIIKKTASVLHQ